MKRLKLILLLASSLICIDVYAEWIEISKSDDLTMYIENSRSKFDENSADVWMKLKYSKPKNLQNNRKVNSVVMRVSVICDKNEIMYQSVEERLDGKLVHSSENPNKEYEETVPGSESDGILNFLCQIAKNR
jgi:hypothetical protein